MNKYSRFSPVMIIRAVAVVVLVGTLTGCATTLLTPGYVGNKIKPGYSILIVPDGRQAVVYSGIQAGPIGLAAGCI